MRWASLIAIPLISLGGSAVAQSVNQSVRGLETCFQTARVADSICEKQTDPQERLNCFEKTRTAQLECLKHVLPDKPGPSANAPETVPPAPPPSAASEAPEEVMPKDRNPAGSSNASENAPKADVKTIPAIPTRPEESTATIQSDTKTIPKAAASSLTKKDWIISETTSPIDYSPLVTALIQPAQQVSNGPVSLTIRCRAKSTELALQFQGDNNPAKTGEAQLDYQIDDQAFVKQRWIWSAGGRTAVYKGDPIPLLQSIPDGARLKIRASESDDAQQGATFLLIGLDPVRKRVGAACKWAALQTQTSSPRR
jgi:Type VI secretion system VasI, EvfG, VC_A0118